MASKTVPAPGPKQAPKREPRKLGSAAAPWSFKTSRRGAPDKLHTETVLCFPEDQRVHLPEHRQAPDLLPQGAPMPRVGEVICLNSTSCWAVTLVIHEWRTPTSLCIQVWLEFLGTSRVMRNPNFTVAQ